MRGNISKENFILLALAAANGAEYTPIQLQKLLFLLNDRVANKIGIEKQFTFIPYNYGPFDSSIYYLVKSMQEDGLIKISNNQNRQRTFQLTEKGQELGTSLLKQIEDKYRQYIIQLNRFVRESSFRDLVMAIYHAYPEMKVNSLLFK